MSMLYIWDRGRECNAAAGTDTPCSDVHVSGRVLCQTPLFYDEESGIL